MTDVVPSSLVFRRGTVDVSIVGFLVGHPVAEELVIDLAVTNAAADQGVDRGDVRLAKDPSHVRRDPEIRGAWRRTYNYTVLIGDSQ